MSAQKKTQRKKNQQKQSSEEVVKSGKKETPVLIGKPDGPLSPQHDNDFYNSKIGGVPVWLDPAHPPSAKVCTCQQCREPMHLIFQGYVPLSDSPYHRVLYVWACNRRQCMRKEGSFSVLRSHRIDPAYLKAQQLKEKKAQQLKEKKAAPFAVPAGFQLGDLWGAGPSMASSQTPFSFSSSSPSSSSCAVPAFGAVTPEQLLTQKLSHLSIQPAPTPEPKTLPPITDPVDSTQWPHFPAEYLYITEENTETYESLGLDISKYQKYIDMEADILAMNEEPSEEGTWAGETYEKQSLPRGVDKEFKKFTERVSCDTQQCIRYDWEGSPLFYSKLQPLQQQASLKKCALCGGPRVFECQLMPNILSLLPTTEHAAEHSAAEHRSENTPQNTPSNKRIDQWSIGMEFGTVLVYVCKKDCHPADIQETVYLEEVVIVQYESDG